MTTPVGLPNYQQLAIVQAGRETVRGTRATKTNKWYGRLDLTRRQPLAESDEFAGTFYTDYTPVRGAVMVDGTYYQPMSYEDAHLFTYGIQGAVTPVSDAQSTPGYVAEFKHSGTRDTLDTASVEYSKGGLLFESEGLVFPEITLSSDIDDPQAVWKLNARAVALSKELKALLEDVAATSGSTTTFVKTAWGQTIDALIGRYAHFKTGTANNVGLFREVLDNDATTLTFAALPSAVAAADTIDLYAMPTGSIADRTREMVKGPGTLLYLDNSGGTIGTTQVAGRFISFSVTFAQPRTYKRFMENTDTLSNKVDIGTIRVSGQLRLEFDRRREWDKYVDLTSELIRIKQTGSTIDSGAGTKKHAQIDIFNAVYDDPTEDVRGNNCTVTFPFRGYVNTSEGAAAELSWKSTQSALLA